MSTVEHLLPWISSMDMGPLSRVSLTGGLVGRAADRPASRAVEARSRVGTCSLRQIVGSAVADAEGEAIRRALTATIGNKSQAARLLRTNYTTLHAKMKRYGISAAEFLA
jgi:DNA-binding NtrC family response regulator